MSRSYRISVEESVTRIIRAEDKVCTQLEILEVLPPEQMAELIAAELEQRGFQREGDKMVQDLEDGVKVTIDLRTGEVTVAAQMSEETEKTGTKTGHAWDDAGPSAEGVRDQLRGQLREELERAVEKEEGRLQSKVTDKLEGHLGDLRQQLDQAVNRATAEA